MNRGRVTAAALLLLAILLPEGCASTHRVPGTKAGAPEILYIETDTAWSGDVRVTGVVHVRKSATLTILPGTRVLFAKRVFPEGADPHEGFVGPGIRVEGRIVAAGTPPESWDLTFSTLNGCEVLSSRALASRRARHEIFSRARNASVLS